jgi:hypothetical protein
MASSEALRSPDRSWAKGAIGFRPSFLDFDRGIHVGNLEPHERITRILKAALEACFRTPFVTERWGRGVYWQWIGYLARENRAAKPLSSDVSFGCSKFFITVDTEERRFKCGLQVERGYLRAPAGFRACRLRADWDWHRLLSGLAPRKPLLRELTRLVSEGFEIQAGSWSEPHVFTGRRLPPVRRFREPLERAPGNEWCGFQAYYALDEADVRATSGPELVDIMLAVFDEVSAALSLCSQVPLPSTTGRS